VIFVTVGTQLPFDRLIKAVDIWAQSNLQTKVIAQIGPSKFHPKALTASEFMAPEVFDRHFAEANLIVAHAGMGSILGALSTAKPIIIMPRSAHLGEHRNEHQKATADRFRNRAGVLVADDETSLTHHLDHHAEINGGSPISPYASPELITTLRNFIEAS
tara:strand:- start:113167 stop:113646 length:480 start_codon:yes stop_codon:yes gene_type:complete